jgi:cytochrome c oxidase subunit I+III
MPDQPWGMRCVPIVESRYPLWDQKDLMRKVDEGRFFLADAEELRRETIVTSVLDAKPIQCLRVPGPTFLAMITACFTGGAFIFATFHWWTLTMVSGVLALGALLTWLWTGTADIPEKPAKDVGLGLTLPLYSSGPKSVGWWAMFITMMADATAFAGLAFGYFFYWTIHADFPPEEGSDPGSGWLVMGLFVLTLAWALTVSARRWIGRGQIALARMALAAAAALAIVGGLALLAGPWSAGLVPSAHVYPAIVWVLVIWTAVHVGVGVIMQLYCLAGSFTGKLSQAHDIDIWNVALYWHFAGLTALVTVGIVTVFPLMS